MLYVCAESRTFRSDTLHWDHLQVTRVAESPDRNGRAFLCKNVPSTSQKCDKCYNASLKTFYYLLVNSFIAGLSSMLVWFSLTLWVYVQTQSVLATSIMSGVYLIAVAVTGMWFGSLIDHHKKKHMMILSSTITFFSFLAGFVMYLTIPMESFSSDSSPQLWLLIFTLFVGVIASNIRSIALPTVTTLLVEEENRDKANGLSGTVNGVIFLIASIISGFLLATSGMYWIMISVLVLLTISILHLFTITIPEDTIIDTHTAESASESTPKKFDLFETIRIIRGIPGLLPLILFTSFNNFLGGVFMPLMDPYGLSLVSLQVWGILWGVLSLGFIFGGTFIAKFGLGKSPLKTLFNVNIILWIICIFFTIQPSIILVSVGLFLYICLIPFIEASEQTIIQKIVPKARQGRVFGLAQSVETAASPLTAFAIGPITQFFFIPFMTTGAGVDLIGGWFGVGPGRGIALVFILSGCLGLIATIIARHSGAFQQLLRTYNKV